VSCFGAVFAFAGGWAVEEGGFGEVYPLVCCLSLLGSWEDGCCNDCNGGRVLITSMACWGNLSMGG
jgi:hypothetical protein